MPLFTVFTPTFNRAHLLQRAYKSLCLQSCRDFEWLIVDDGSTDDTESLVCSWLELKQVPIRYVWQKNGHKKKAFNRGVREARGELFLPLDSDDAAAPEALAVLERNWKDIPEHKRQDFAGVCALCVDEYGRLIGSRFPEDVFDSDSLEIRYRYGVLGDKWGFIRTDVLKEHPFPEEVTGHVPEGIIWSAIAQHKRTRFINDKLLHVYRESAGSITLAGQSAGGPAQHCEGHALWAHSVLQNELNWFYYRPSWFFKMAANHTRFSLHLRDRQPEKILTLRGWRSKVISALTLPAGYALYWRDRLRK